MLKTVICDDLEDARYVIKRYIEELKLKEIQVVGEAENSTQLFQLCKEKYPDIILLDVSMPGLNGIDAAKEIIKSLPHVSIVFTTAYESYAANSFSVYPVDYIVKPIDMERLGQTLRKIIDNKINKNHTDCVDSNLIIINDHKRIVIEQRKIIFIERMGRKTLIHTVDKIYETYDSIRSIEKKLDSSIFVRAHSSYLINRSFTFAIEKSVGRSYKVHFELYDKPASINRDIIKLFNKKQNVTS